MEVHAQLSEEPIHICLFPLLEVDAHIYHANTKCSEYTKKPMNEDQ